MNLFEFCELFECQIKIMHRKDNVIRMNGEGSRWYAGMDKVACVFDGMEGSITGNGSTPNEALQDMVKEMSGKRLKITVYGENETHYDRRDCPDITLDGIKQ